MPFKDKQANNDASNRSHKIRREAVRQLIARHREEYDQLVREAQEKEGKHNG